MKLLLALLLMISLEGIYQHEIGVRERSGHNDGAKVEQYLKYVGLKRGNLYGTALPVLLKMLYGGEVCLVMMYLNE